MSLVDIFVKHAAGRTPIRDAAAFEGALAALWQAGCQRWPQIQLPAETFVQYLATRVPRDTEPEIALGNVEAADLYIGCGCALGLASALAEFDRHFVAEGIRGLSRNELLGGFADEVKQGLRNRLLVANGNAEPRIASYSGRGSLLAWVRIAATRLALNMRKADKRRTRRETFDQVGVIQPSPDPELSHFKQHYGVPFRAAFEATLAGLPSREATVVRLHFLEGVPADAIAALYKVTARSVQRWLVDARQTLLDETKRRLVDDLQVGQVEVDSLMRFMSSDFDASVTRLLQRPE